MCGGSDHPVFSSVVSIMYCKSLVLIWILVCVLCMLVSGSQPHRVNEARRTVMGMRAVFATVENKDDHEQGMILNHTTVQWASFIPAHLAYAMAADEDNQQNKVIGLFYHACRMYDHISCIDNQIVKIRSDVKEMSIPAGSDDKGHEVRLSVDGGQKLDFAESQSQYTSSIDLAKVFVEDHDHNQDGISVLLNKDAGVFWFHSNLGRCFMKSDISGEVVFDFKPGVWYSYTMQELADLGHHFTIE